MDIRSVQQCRSIDGWQPINVRSSEGDKTYTVLVNPWGDPDNNICECPGYHYRGQCRHQHVADHILCGWQEIEPRSEKQTQEQRRAKICPRCGEGTMWVMEDFDELNTRSYT